VLIGDETPWARRYRGLWGLDTEDPLRGERAPAGPRYERDGSVRRAWADPVAWAGLLKVPPTEEQSVELLTAAIGELDRRLGELDERVDLDRGDRGARRAVHGRRGVRARRRFASYLASAGVLIVVVAVPAAVLLLFRDGGSRCRPSSAWPRSHSWPATSATCGTAGDGCEAHLANVLAVVIPLG
jgi:hypothetical protein